MDSGVHYKVVEQFPETPGLVKHIFRVRFNQDQFLKVADQHQPNLIIGLGQYPRGKRIRVETTAYNSYHSKSHPSSRVVIPRSSSALPLSFIPPLTPDAYLSTNPGRYVCNYSMYLFAHYSLSHNAKSCFLHLPKSCNPDTTISFIKGILRNIQKT